MLEPRSTIALPDFRPARRRRSVTLGGLVDDRDDAERHPHLAQVQAVGQAPALDHLADGVRQRRDLAGPPGRSPSMRSSSSRRRSSRASPMPSRSPACMSSSLAARISGVRVAQRAGDRRQRGVLDRGVAAGERASARLAAAQVSATPPAWPASRDGGCLHGGHFATGYAARYSSTR